MLYFLFIPYIQCHEEVKFDISAQKVNDIVSELCSIINNGKKFKKSAICERIEKFINEYICNSFILKELNEYNGDESYVQFIKENYVQILSHQFKKDYKSIREYFAKIKHIKIEECEQLYDHVYICKGNVSFSDENAQIKVIVRNEDNIIKIESFELNISGLKISLASKLIPYFHLLAKEHFLPSKWEKKTRKLINK